jgi:hypothetical protein
MTMRIVLSALLTALAVCFTGCNPTNNNDDSAHGGTVRMALEGTGPNGATYRLRDGIFEINGGSVSESLDTEVDPTAVILSTDLPAGAYGIELQPGWRFEREVAGVVNAVNATLVSDNPVAFAIQPSITTDVIYVFEVDGGLVSLEPGTVSVGIEVVFAACDPAAQTGCAAGMKCTQAFNEGLAGPTDCHLPGLALEGEACSAPNDGTADDCVAGTFCLSGVCTAICDTTGATPLPTDCGNCLQYTGVFADHEGTGLCVPQCDAWDQGSICAPTEACYFNTSNGSQVCANPYTAQGGLQGDLCNFINGCETGYGCSLPDDPDNQTGLSCGYYCDPLDNAPSCADGPGPAYTCIALGQLYNNVDSLPSQGVCVDCVAWPAATGCP